MSLLDNLLPGLTGLLGSGDTTGLARQLAQNGPPSDDMLGALIGGAQPAFQPRQLPSLGTESNLRSLAPVTTDATTPAVPNVVQPTAAPTPPTSVADVVKTDATGPADGATAEGEKSRRERLLEALAGVKAPEKEKPLQPPSPPRPGGSVNGGLLEAIQALQQGHGLGGSAQVDPIPTLGQLIGGR